MDLVVMDRNRRTTDKVTGIVISDAGQVVPQVGDTTDFKGRNYRVDSRHVPLGGFGQVITIFLVEI
jgi:cell wall assembly regulator SMI1